MNTSPREIPDNPDNLVTETGRLFGSLWKPFDDQSFEFSIGLFRKRFEANGFDLDWFRGKKCLDAGCGGGRYSIAMAREGAASVVGVDVGQAGLEDARCRATDYRQVSFREASVLDLPFQDEEFDFVFCSGILMITPDPERGFAELCRVLKPKGRIYLLLYASGGVRWPAVMEFRRELNAVAADTLKDVMQKDNFPANKIRTLMDDLKVPLIDFYHWEYVTQQLHSNGVSDIQRWEAGRLDHEESLDEMIDDMRWFERCFAAGEASTPHQGEFGRARQIANQYVKFMQHMRDQTLAGVFTNEESRRMMIGQGHHRLLGVKK